MQIAREEILTTVHRLIPCVKINSVHVDEVQYRRAGQLSEFGRSQPPGSLGFAADRISAITGDRTKALRADPSKSRGVRGAIRRPPVEDIPSDRSFWEYRETVGHGAAARLQHMIASSVPSGALGGARDACAPSGVSRLLKSPTGTCTRAHVRPC